jgi:hypothetical protein
MFSLIEPLAENPSADLLQCRAMAGAILSDRARMNSSLGKLGRVADQPGFDPLRVYLDMELNSEQVWTFPEGLVRTMRCEGKIVAGRR